MKALEKRLFELGFEKLQEKEDMIFYEKFIHENENSDQICIIYDKTKKRINSMDTFSIRNDEMSLSSKHDYHTKSLKRELKQLMSS